MKRYFKFLPVFSIVLLMSCDFGKNNSPDHSTDGRVVPENEEITNTTNYKNTGNFGVEDELRVDTDKVVDSLNENWNLDNPKRKETLYSRFNMTQDQIQQYESALQSWNESANDDAYKLLSAGAKIKKEDEILKKILNDAQYDEYQDWAKANDLRN